MATRWVSPTTGSISARDPSSATRRRSAAASRWSFLSSPLEGPLPRHGFARTSLWSLGCIAREADGTAEAEFVLRDSAETRSVWDAQFKAVLAVTVVARQLAITLRVENVGEKPFSFTAALHTYLACTTSRDAEIHGLRGTLYRVSGDRALVADDADRLLLPDYIDRVYVGAPRHSSSASAIARCSSRRRAFRMR